jgi:zinc/manganese transport system substrate-binding protein
MLLGLLTAGAEAAHKIEVPSTRVDRSSGDVHPLGNPHYSLDPGLAPIVTQNIVDGLARVAPELRATFEKNREAFLARFGLVQMGMLEDRPGIPPSPQHLAQLTMVGGVKGVDTYIGTIDYNVNVLAQALR